MLFLGNMAIPNAKCAQKMIADMKPCGVFDAQTKVVNLKGILHHENHKDTYWKAYNDRSTIGLKSICKKAIFGFANNHIYDYPKEIQPMHSLLEKEEIPILALQRRMEQFLLWNLKRMALNMLLRNNGYGK